MIMKIHKGKVNFDPNFPSNSSSGLIIFLPENPDELCNKIQNKFNKTTWN